jgi:hypothetical protein
MASLRTGHPHRWWRLRPPPSPRVLGWVTSGLILLDAYVHAHDASIYDANRSAVLSQGTLFRLEAVTAALVAVALIGWPRRAVWAAALLTAASAAAAALLYRYVDIGPLGPLPNMYEPTWATPGAALRLRRRRGHRPQRRWPVHPLGFSRNTGQPETRR